MACSTFIIAYVLVLLFLKACLAQHASHNMPKCRNYFTERLVPAFVIIYKHISIYI